MVVTAYLRDKRERLPEELFYGRELRVMVGHSTCSFAKDAEQVKRALEASIAARQLDATLVEVGCNGMCYAEVLVEVAKKGGPRILYTNINPGNASLVVDHFNDYLRSSSHASIKLAEEVEVTRLRDEPFYALQERRVLEHVGQIDPYSLDEYLAVGGYEGLRNALSMTPDEVIKEVSASGLRGRGGAGFPTGLKWKFTRGAESGQKYVICNADEGDPGAFMNRLTAEGNPFTVIEGLTIAAYAVGATKGYIFVRAEKPLMAERLRRAVASSRERGFLGGNIMGKGFSLDVDVILSAGAFVCGEETAMIAAIEGRRAMPRPRPPYPASKGLWDKPTNINNVETLAHVSLILRKGSRWFSDVGSERSKGTKVFCLAGLISKPGAAEVPFGTSIGRLVFEVGGGSPDGSRVKAVQIGGPSGGCVPVEYFDYGLDYESLTSLGAIMGSGGLIVLTESNCMVDLARYFLTFTSAESCGECVPCRIGLAKMLNMLTEFVSGRGEQEDLISLTNMSRVVADSSLCALGQTAPNPVLTTLRYFHDEHEVHIIDKKCPAAVCRPLFRTPCQHVCPLELNVPGYVALVKNKELEQAYKLIVQRNPFPSICGRVCHHPCEAKCRRGQVDEPIAINDIKRFVADWAFEHGVEYLLPVRKKNGVKIAIAGSGPAGLTAAYDLVREGYEVTVFEALPVAGGMLAVGIPDYRLPKKILGRETERIRRLGVDIRLNTPVRDIESLLKDGYKAVFVAVGAHKGIAMGIPGEDLEGVFDAIEFLEAVNLGKKTNVGKKVAVVGGGNSAVDAARVALRSGAQEVHIIYRRERKDMPAIPEEVHAAEEEGVHLHCLLTPSRILGRNGKVVGLECVRMELREFDRSGRKTPYPIEGSECTVEADMVIEAVGQRPDSTFLKDKIEIGRGGTIFVDPRTLATSMEGVFAGGDAVTGLGTVTEAMAAGRRAASSIRRYCKGEKLQPRPEYPAEETFSIPSIPPTDEETERKSRTRVSQTPPEERRSDFREIIQPYSVEEATEEAGRCLRCDLEVSE